MSEVKVNKISPRTNCGTVQLGDSGDTITIPAGATITNNGTQTGFGRTGTVDWQTGSIKTTTFTAANGEGYFANTSGGAFTMNLPAGTAGNIVSVVDYTNTFQTHNLTITPNGSQKIGGVNANAILSTEGQSVTFVYVDDTEGWKNVQDSTSNATGQTFVAATGGTVTTCGNDKIHTFTGPGTFCVSSISTTSSENTISYAVVAGGGGGGSGYQTGGGGAGGFREFKSSTTPYSASPLDGNGSGGTAITLTATAFPITVGAGGAAGPASPSDGTKGSNGNPSVFSTITSTAGGAGAAYNPVSGPIQDGNPGGSGGGAGRMNANNPGGNGNTPPVSPAQGKDGGAANQPYNHPYSGGGGGGATTGGSNSGGSAVGNAGTGATTSITGSSLSYAGGGGGGGYGAPAPSSDSGDAGAGSSCGTGGRGGFGGPGQPTSCGVAGTTNRGGGGGGSSYETTVGGAGGSGVVIIRYKFQ